MKTSIVLVGLNSIQREGIASILRKGGFSHLHNYNSVEELSRTHLPSSRRIVFLIYLRQKLSELSDVVGRLRAECPTSCIVLLAESSSEAIIMQAIECNVDGLLLDKIERDALIKSLELVMLGEKVFPANNLLHICKQNSEISVTDIDANTLLDLLSTREIQVLQKLTAGYPNKVIARDCGITESTVKVHVKAILRKIRAKNRTQAAVWARKFGISLTPYLGSPNLTVQRMLPNRDLRQVHDRLSVQPDAASQASVHQHSDSKN